MDLPLLGLSGVWNGCSRRLPPRPVRPTPPCYARSVSHKPPCYALGRMGAVVRDLSPLGITRELHEVAADDPRILALYLFGSRSRGEEAEQSDVDLGVLFRQRQTLEDVLLLEDLIERRLGVPVDLVDAARANAFLALDIIRGERVYCADEGRCDEFDLYVMRRAGDLAPFERERRRLLLQP